MKIMVTGSNGFVGSAVVERLLAHGERNIRCLVRPSSDRSRLEALRPTYPEGFHYCVGTLNRMDDCHTALEGGIDVVYHLAAALSGTPASMFLSSVVASKNLLEAVASTKAETKVIHCSSFGVYGVAGLPRRAVLNEQTSLEPHPEWRDIYSHAKHRQETLFWQYQKKHGFPLTVLRPGVIYGPGGSAMSNRVGLSLFGLFLLLGGKNVLPLTYVDNCAEAMVVAGCADASNLEAYNVVDDDLVTCTQFFKRYRREINEIPYVPVPYAALRAMSWAVQWYHVASAGQLPAVFTPYKSVALWGGNRFDNSKLKALGWRQPVATPEALRRHFEYQKSLKAG